MTKSIDLLVRNVYGVEAYYPACTESAAFARIAGTKTLTIGVLRDVKALGYTINVIRPTTAIDTLIETGVAV